MRLRQLVLACGFSSFVLSQYASALGLGEVKLNSTLNQPLDAEVKLLDTRDLSAEQILVTLASPADFERNNVERLYFYTEFQFEVILNAPGGPKVHITTRNPVREPYLNFLIEARWTAGRLLREYTLLMDLPTFEQDATGFSAQPARATNTPAPQTTRTAPRATSPNATPPSRSVAPAPRATTRTSSEPAPTRRAAQATISGDEYQVRTNDTLWEIASRVRTDNSVSVHQAMMALYRENPDAFINGNINKLRRGQVLRIPSSDEMREVTRTDAVSQFAQSADDTSMGAQLSASRRQTTARTEPTETSGRVKLAAPSSGSTGAGLGSGANDGAGNALESELAGTLEELDKSKAENTELNARVKDLEAQINTMQRLVDVSNEKLRALQVAAKQQTAATGAASSEAATSEVSIVEAETSEAAASEVAISEVAMSEAAASVSAAVVEEESDESSEDLSQEQSQEQSSVADTAVAAVATGSSVAAASSIAASSLSAAVPPKKIIPPYKPKPSFVDSLVANAPWIGLGVIVIAGVAYVLHRRRKDNELGQDDTHDDIFALDTASDANDATLDDVADYQQATGESLGFEEEQAPAIAETGDVVSEADIYIAYGKLDQAEEMLLNGLKKDPNSVDIRMKLLEVYAQQQNISRFDKHYSALLPLAGGAVLARASELREHIEGAGEFTPEPNAELDGDEFDYSGESDADSFALGDFQLDDDLSPAFDASNDREQGSDVGQDLSDDFASLDSTPTDTVVRKTSGYEPELDSNFEPRDATDDEFDMVFKEQHEDQHSNLGLTTTGADDLSELSLALDDLDRVDEDTLPKDITSSAIPADEEFSYDLDDEQDQPEVVLDTEDALEPDADLEVAADDFNLDLDAGSVDLAALDHEMESLDTDFDSNETNGLTELDSAFAADDLDSGLDTDTSTASIDLADDNALIELDEYSASFNEQGPDGNNSNPIYELELADGETPADDEEIFAEALSGLPEDSDDLNIDQFSSDATDLSDDDMDAELDFLADADEAATKLDLARAYIDMGDSEGAKDILAEVVNEGNDEQRKEAADLLGRINV